MASQGRPSLHGILWREPWVSVRKEPLLRTVGLTLVALSLFLALACGGNGYDCSEEEYDRFETIFYDDGMTSEVEEWVEECGNRFE